MQSTPPVVPSASAQSMSVRSLAAALAAVPDPRRHARVTYPLASTLTLAVSALLANHHSVRAIAEWGQRQSAELLQPLGFSDGQTPGQPTRQRLFAKLDGRRLSAVLTEYFAPLAPSDRLP